MRVYLSIFRIDCLHLVVFCTRVAIISLYAGALGFRTGELIEHDYRNIKKQSLNNNEIHSSSHLKTEY